MKIKVQIEDRDALEFVTMLTAIGQHLEKKGNSNNVLYAGVEVLKSTIFNALINQLPPERVNEICQK